MRQPQQKHRGRGRGRKPHNPLSRNFESNGPEVKIRGNAGNVAEKYMSLARDALSSGDTVTAENFFQHAEHYNRIVAAAQAQNTSRNEEGQQNADKEANQSINGGGPQPQIEGVPAEVMHGEDDKQASRKIENATEEHDKPPVAQKSRRRTSRQEPVENTEAEQAASKKDMSADVEAISEDAAGLPGSITGGVVTEDDS